MDSTAALRIPNLPLLQLGDNGVRVVHGQIARNRIPASNTGYHLEFL